MLLNSFLLSINCSTFRVHSYILAPSVVNGAVKEGTDEWYDMVDAIQEVKEKIDDATVSEEEYLQKVRETHFDMLQHSRNAISTLNDEADFYKDILAYQDMFDENGNTTDAGKTTLALDLTKMSNFIALNQKLNDVLKENEELYSNDVIEYDEYLERRKSLISEQQDAIKGYYSEIDAIETLVKEGYDSQKNALSDLIDKYKKALSAEKDLHDYEKNVKKQTDNISSIKKRIAALQGNDTEEARQRISQLSISLKDAEEQLEETQYDKYIKDQEDILSDLQDNYEKFIENQLKNIDVDIKQLIANAREDSQTAIDTIAKLADKWGINISEALKGDVSNGDYGTVDNPTGGAIDNANNIYNKDYDLSNKATTDYIKQKQDEENQKREEAIRKAREQELIDRERRERELKEQKVKDDDAYSKKLNSEREKQILYENQKIANSKAQNEKENKLLPILEFLNSHVTDAKQKKSYYGDLNQYIYAKTGGKVLSRENEKKLASLLGVKLSTDLTGKKGKKELSKIRDALKAVGFSTGGAIEGNTSGDTLLLRAAKKERVLTPEQNAYWEEWTKSLPNLIDLGVKLPKVDIGSYIMKNPARNISIGDINVELNGSNITDAESFIHELKSSNKLRSCIQEITIGATRGNKLGVNKY